MATQRQIDANRKNAALSSGPKTEAGKLASRANALKHGLACQSIDLELEITQSPAFQARRDSWAATYQPTGEIADWAMDRVVASSFRIERCERAVETIAEATAERAKQVWDQDQAIKAANLGSRLASNPSLIARKLEATWHGVDLMVDWWIRLEAALQTGEDWSEADASRALDLLGVPTSLRTGRTPIDDPESGPLVDYRRELAGSEIDRLEGLRDTSLASIDDLDRRQASSGDTALFGAPARLVLRYEREAWRQYRESVAILTAPPSSIESEPKPKPKTKTEPEIKPEPTAVAPPKPKPVPTPVPTPEAKSLGEMSDDEFNESIMIRYRAVKLARETAPADPKTLPVEEPVTGTNPICGGAGVGLASELLSGR